MKVHKPFDIYKYRSKKTFNLGNVLFAFVRNVKALFKQRNKCIES